MKQVIGAFIMIAIAGFVISHWSSDPSSSDSTAPQQQTAAPPAKQKSDKGTQQAKVSDSKSATDTADNDSADSDSIAYKLAEIQNNGPLDKSDLLVRQFKAQLDVLATKFDDPKGSQHKAVGLANMTMQVHDDLEAKGIDDSYLTILTQVNADITPGTSVGKEINVIFATYYESRIPR